MSENFNDLPEYFNRGNDVIKIGEPGIFKFHQGDSEELYNKNLEKQPKNWYYRNVDVIYNFNSYGYRTDEFDEIDWKNSIILFGCSLVLGVGVEEKHTLSYLLSQKINRPVINMGISASSNDLMLYNSVMIKKKYSNPYGVIFLWSGHERYTYFGQNNIRKIGAWSGFDLGETNNFEDDLLKNMISEWTHNSITTFYMIECAKQLWKDSNVNLHASYFKKTSEYGKILLLPFWDSEARDVSHPGAESNMACVDVIYGKLTKKII